MRIFLLLLTMLSFIGAANAQVNESQLLSGTELDEPAPAPAVAPLTAAQYLLTMQQNISTNVMQELGRTNAKPGSKATARLSVDAQGQLREARIVSYAGSPQVKQAMERVLKKITALMPPPPELLKGRPTLDMDIGYEIPQK
jgi:hypothetical protein